MYFSVEHHGGAGKKMESGYQQKLDLVIASILSASI